MSLTTYTGLKQSLLDWGKNASLTSYLDDFITLAEARIARDIRIKSQVQSTTLSTSIVSPYATALPSDWLETENVTLTADIPYNLQALTPEQMDAKWPAGLSTGIPRFWTVVGTNMYFGPTPDQVYSITLQYYQRFPGIVANATNWLLTNHPNIYLSACLYELNKYTKDQEAMNLWLNEYMADKDKLIQQDDTALRSGSALRVRVT